MLLIGILARSWYEKEGGRARENPANKDSVQTMQEMACFTYFLQPNLTLADFTNCWHSIITGYEFSSHCFHEFTRVVILMKVL